jgi:hypothetical protein
MHAGDALIVDSPSAESLRVSARLVRELAGERLLGICVFRLPATDDPATLTIAQVATALADHDSTPDFKINFRSSPALPRGASLEIENTGTANAISGFKIDITSRELVPLCRRASIETIFAGAAATNVGPALQPAAGQSDSDYSSRPQVRCDCGNSSGFPQFRAEQHAGFHRNANRRRANYSRPKRNSFDGRVKR